MDIYETISTRKSVRAYEERPVEEEKLRRVLEAVRMAPSARNEQEWRFVVIRDPVVRKRIATEATRHSFIGSAPILLACCAETDGRLMQCGQPAYTIDVAIAMDHLSLAAVAEGLGTCWIGGFDESKVKAILSLPAAVRVVELMPLGYPVDPSPAAKKRLPLETIVMDGGWRGR